MSVKITGLGDVILPLVGSEVLEISQMVSGVWLSKKITVTDLSANIGGLDADFVTLSANVQLPNERILTAGTNISIVDGGPGSTITINGTTPPPPAGNLPVPTVDGAMLHADLGGGVWLEAVDLTWIVTPGTTNVLTLGDGAAQGATANIVINKIAPSGRVLDIFTTASTNYEIIRARDQTGANYFNIRHDYSLSAPNHRLHIERTGNIDVFTCVNNGTAYFFGQFDILFDSINNYLKLGNSYHLEFDERASIGSVGAGDGALYVRSDTPNVLVFKDENDTEWVLNTAGGGTLAALTDVDLTGQAQYDLLFNVDGTNWEDTAGDLIFDVAAQALQFAAGVGINMGAAPLRVLEVASSGTPSTTIEHATVEVIAEVSTVSNVEVPLTGGTLPLLTEGNEYLLMAVAQHHQGNTGGENVHGADIAVAATTGVPFSNMRDDIEPPACAVASDQGQWFTGMNQIQYSVASHGQITLEHSAGAGQTHYVNNAILMAFNLTDFGVENTDWFNSTTAPFVTVTDAGWSNLSPTITIGDGVSDWLLFGSFQVDQPQAGGQIQFGLFNGSVNTEYAMHQFADTQDIKSIVFSAVFTGIAATTFQTAARAVAASGNTARIFTSGIYALRLNRFAQYSIQSAAGPTNPGSGAEFSLLTDSVVASSSSDWGIMAFAQNRWVGNALSGTVYGRANINAGGFTTIAGFDTPPVSVVENAAVERTPKVMVPRITELTGVVATDTVGAELRWIPASTFATDEASVYNMVMFTWDTFDSSVNATTLGDPTIDTRIDGAAVNFFGEYSLPLLDGAAGEGLVTDGLGQLSFAAASIPDPLILGSINLTSALSTSALGAPYANVPINIGNSLSGTQGMTQLSRQRIQTKPSAFSFNSTLFINTDGAGTSGSDTIIGGLNSANIEVEFGVAVRFQHALLATVVAETTSAAAGGFLANNLATGAGLERVLTTSDLGGGGIGGSIAIDQLAFGSGVDTIEGSANLMWNDVILTAGSTAQSAATGFLAQNNAGGIRLMIVNATGQGTLTQFSAAGAVEDTWMTFDRNAGITMKYNNLNRLATTSIGVLLQGPANPLLQITLDVANTVDFDFTNCTRWNLNSFTRADFSNLILENISGLYLAERGSAQANVANQGQFWVRSSAPNRPTFTDDTGIDQLLDPSISEIISVVASRVGILTDKGKTVGFTGSTAAQTMTIPASGSVAYQIGTLLAWDNSGSVSISIAITTDTLIFADDNSTGTRTLAAGGAAVAQKVGATTWKISGAGLS